MKKITLFLLFIFTYLQLWSKQVEQDEAKHVAENFINNNISDLQQRNISFQLNLVYTAKNEENKSKKNHSQNYYYVYNIGNKQGFIIISADDINYPIIGYSTSGYYDINNIPENFRLWMRTIELGMQEAFKNSSQPTEEIRQEWEVYRNSDININKNTKFSELQPLIKTKWNQMAPYNSQIPYDVVTGCVATATAQIMKFHQYPKSGMGKIPAYETIDPNNNVQYNIPEIDLQQYEYDWSNMLNEYINSPTPAYTKEQGKAVGLLMYHIGASVKMKYGIKESVVSSRDALKSLYAYYDYDKGIDYIVRGKYYNSLNEILISDEEWGDIIIKELNEGRPIYYSGSTEKKEGHAFICDGYDSNGLLHFNFGWGGYQDGYYNSNAPLEYKYGQSIGINIKPNNGGKKVNRYFINELTIPKNRVYKEECFNEIHKLYNIGIEDDIDSKNLYMALYDLNENIIAIFNAGSHPRNFNTNNYKIDSNIPAGKYRLKVVEKKDNTYVAIKTAKAVEGNNIIEVIDGIKSHNLFLRDELALQANLIQAGPKDDLKVKFSVGNTRCKPFTGMLALALTNEKDELKYILNKSSISNLQEGYFYPSYLISGMIPDDILNGEYRIRIFARENDNQEWQFLEGATINYLPLTIINGKLGTEDIKNENNEFVIYPNPVKNTLYIKLNSEEKIKSTSIYDFSGKKVLEGNLDSSYGINVSQLSPGAYIIKILTSKEVKKYKFIKK